VTEREEILKLRAALEVLTLEGNLDSDIPAAYFDLGCAPAASSRAKLSIAFAREVLARYDNSYRVNTQVSARVITKEEHDSLLDGPKPQSVSREEYERMMREAQE
jgi:hypothetical protein